MYQESLIKEAVRAAGSKSAAVKALVDKGYRAIEKNDPETGMKRFNQAWLLDANNRDVFWGMGIAASIMRNFDASFKVFDKALTLDPRNTILLNDIAYGWIQKGLFSLQQKKNDAQDSFIQAERYLDMVKSLRPTDDKPYAHNAMINYYRGDFGIAWKNVKDAETRGGASLDPRFVKDLETRMPRP